MSRKNRFKINKNNRVCPNIKVGAGSGYHKLLPVFSFIDYIEAPQYFSEEHANEARNSLYKFLLSIKEFSKFNWGYIQSHPDVFHFHEIRKNIPILEDNYSSIDILQFKIPGQKQGRFVGFFDENNIFHILIYDSQHNIYERE